MSFNAFRQTSSKYDFGKSDGNGERLFHVMSKEKGTAKFFKTIKINNDFLRMGRAGIGEAKKEEGSGSTEKGKDSKGEIKIKSQKSGLLSRQLSSVKLDYKSLNGQKVLYDEHSESRFPWTQKNWFKATATTPEIVKTFSQEQVSCNPSLTLKSIHTK